MMNTKFKMEKFERINNFGMWQLEVMNDFVSTRSAYGIVKR